MSKPVTSAGQKRPAASKRKGRAVPRSPNDPRAQFNYLVALPTVLVFIAVCTMVLFTLYVMTAEINRIDGDRSRKAIAAALDSYVLRLGEQVADEALHHAARPPRYPARPPHCARLAQRTGTEMPHQSRPRPR